MLKLEQTLKRFLRFVNTKFIIYELSHQVSTIILSNQVSFNNTLVCTCIYNILHTLFIYNLYIFQAEILRNISFNISFIFACSTLEVRCVSESSFSSNSTPNTDHCTFIIVEYKGITLGLYDICHFYV